MTTSVCLKPTGAAMPLVGYGTWKIAKKEAATAVETALKVGYRLLDCACDYGNEQEVGAGLAAAIKNGVVKREDVFVTSKLWNTFHAREHVRPACERTLKDLGLAQLDLYLIHFPISLKYVDFDTRYPPEWANDPADGKLVHSDVTIRETWEAMEELVDAGLVKHIGVSNFNCALLMDLLKYARHPVSVLQIEYHPYLQQPSLIKFCEDRGIAVTGYSNFGPLSFVPLNMEHAVSAPSLFESEVLAGIAKKHNKSIAQIILRFCTQLNVAVIPKSMSEVRMKENLDALTFRLDDDDVKAIRGMNCGLRFNDPNVYADYPIFG